MGSAGFSGSIVASVYFVTVRFGCCINAIISSADSLSYSSGTML